MKPPKRVKRHIARAADQDEPSQPVGAVKPAGSALPSESVLDDQVPVLDANLEPVTVRDDDPGADPTSACLAMRTAIEQGFSACLRGRRRLAEPAARHVLRCRRVRVDRGCSLPANPRMLFADVLGLPAAGR
jgi:hypothetical protein